MPPKFQSSFVPKAPLAGTAAMSGVIPQSRPAKSHDFVAFVVRLVFGLSVLLALGAVGYQFYLKYRIQAMGQELESLRAQIATSETNELIRLNDRIVTTQSLVASHKILSPFFAFLQASTPRSVALTDFDFRTNETGPTVVVKGLAKNYAALGLEAEVIDKNKDLKDPVFSDIRLDEKGNVIFTVRANVAPELLSFAKSTGQTVTLPVPVIATSTPVIATTTATTTKATKTATSTTH